MSRTLVIGDIHGAYKALQQVIARAEVRENDELIFLGDYVDGWSQSFEVIQSLLDLEKRMKCIFIKGNHDVWCQQWLETNMHNESWLLKGGRSTIKSYRPKTDRDKLNHLHFFQRMKNYHIDADNRLFIHAGFASQQGPAKEHHISNFNLDRTLWEMAICMDKRIKRDTLLYPKRLKLFNEIFIGHTPTLKYNSLEPMNAINVWNVDTGAALNGKLSILDVHTKQFRQSDGVKKLYPDENGRSGN